MKPPTTQTETAYAAGLLVSRFLIGMSGDSGERLQQIATQTGRSNIAFLRGIQAWCKDTEIAIERLIAQIEESEAGANSDV